MVSIELHLLDGQPFLWARGGKDALDVLQLVASGLVKGVHGMVHGNDVRERPAKIHVIDA